MSQKRPNAEDRREGDDEANPRPFVAHDESSFSGPANGDFEEWLANHPDADGALADLHDLRELFQANQPSDPDASAWQTVQTRIHQVIPVLAAGRRSTPRPFWFLLGATAAAALISFLLLRSLWRDEVAPEFSAVEPFPVAEEADVTIVSMEAHDVAFLIVGEPPIAGNVEFARAEDIRVIECECCPFSGRKARWEQAGEVPMFVSSTVGAEAPHDE